MRSAADTKAPVRKDSVADLLRQPTIRVEDAAVVLGISRGLAYDLARRGELPGALRLGHRFVVRSAILARVLGLDLPETP